MKDANGNDIIVKEIINADGSKVVITEKIDKNGNKIVIEEKTNKFGKSTRVILRCHDIVINFCLILKTEKRIVVGADGN